MTRKSTQRRRHVRQGATALEFAVVAPIVFGIIWITFEFMRVTMLQNLADVASYEAARVAMVPGAKIAEAEAEANKYMRYLGAREATIAVTAFSGSDTQDEIDDFTSRVRVNVSIPVQSNVLILSRFFGNQSVDSTTSLGFESYSGYYDGATY